MPVPRLFLLPMLVLSAHSLGIIRENNSGICYWCSLSIQFPFINVAFSTEFMW